MILNVPTWQVYTIMLSYVAVGVVLAILLFDRQEEPGYAA